jgi:hypothetical protein
MIDLDAATYLYGVPKLKSNFKIENGPNISINRILLYFGYHYIIIFRSLI